MKVLIISHNPLSTYNAMGKTLLSLFSQFDKEELCQLYIYPGRPNTDICKSYFRITDKDMIKNFFQKSKGEVVCSCEKSTPFDNISDEKIYRKKNNKTPFIRLMRDLLWKISGWNSDYLQEWIREQNPNCIFVAPGAALFLYDIALKISEIYKIPIITYVCDEYYFLNKTFGKLDSYRLKKLRAKMDVLAAKTTKFITISDELNELYSGRFKTEAVTIMTGTDIESPLIQECNTNIISFFGNVRSNRFESLIDIGRILEEINQFNKCKYALNIYTAEKDNYILSQLCNVSSIKIFPFLSGKDFYEAMRSSAFLLHVESFDKKMIDFVKHSISTKIADSLSSGIPLIAYGPPGISSIEYLRKNKCAFISDNLDNLESALTQAFFDTSARQKCVENALHVSQKNHNKKANSILLKSIIQEAIDCQ